MDSARAVAVAIALGRYLPAGNKEGLEMLRSIVLAGTLALLPALAGAEEVWRWQDADGRLHYTNRENTAPQDAEVVRTQIRVVPRSDVGMRPAGMYGGGMGMRRRPPGSGRSGRNVRVTEVSNCCSYAYPWVIINNPHELADQVKQASLLDALGVPWRGGSCP
jgi:hypothetical protein